jgi:uncharacterized tellurite resistance protein B-like protein
MKNKPNNGLYKPSSDYEAWVGILYACIASDGEVGKSEIEALSKMISGKRKFEGIDIIPLCKNVVEAYDKVGANGLVDACSPLIEHADKPTLFSMAVDIILSDGLLELGERKIIEYLANTLMIDKTQVLKIIEVMLIRNKGNVILD